MTEQQQKPKIIYIAGAGHSGTTLLDLVLSTAPGTFSVGELKHLDQFLTDTKKERRDDTGALPAESAFWSWFYEHQDQLLVSKRVERSLSLKNRLRILLTGTPATIPNRYRDNNLLYRKIQDQAQQATGICPSVIIDSSKVLSRLIEVHQTATEFDVYVVHLVRDLRGVAYSHYKVGRSPLHWGVKWLMSNLGVQRYAQKNLPTDRYIPVTYETFAREPDRLLQTLAGQLGIEIDTNNYVEKVNRATSYRFGGNGMRERTFTGISLQETWRTRLPMLYRLLLAPLRRLVRVDTIT